jgi:hypothetical protein
VSITEVGLQILEASRPGWQVKDVSADIEEGKAEELPLPRPPPLPAPVAIKEPVQDMKRHRHPLVESGARDTNPALRAVQEYMRGFSRAANLLAADDQQQVPIDIFDISAADVGAWNEFVPEKTSKVTVQVREVSIHSPLQMGTRANQRLVPRVYTRVGRVTSKPKQVPPTFKLKVVRRKAMRKYVMDALVASQALRKDI